MKITQLSREAQAGLYRWANEVLDDELAMDSIGSVPQEWAWICILLRQSEDKPEWFPKGKSATIQVIEDHLYREARAAMRAAKS
jgi:hypothetical protein